MTGTPDLMNAWTRTCSRRCGVDPSPAAIEAAAEAMLTFWSPLPDPTGIMWTALDESDKQQLRTEARAALVAALPIIRAELAEQIEAASDNIALYDEGRKDAARIVRGDNT